MGEMSSFVHSLTTNLRERLSTFSPLPALSALFKPRDTMSDLNPWTLLVERTLCQSTAHTLRLYISAAEKLEDFETVLDRLEVVWVWFNKLQELPEHEYFVIETVDRLQNNLTRRFLLERTILRNDSTEDTKAQDTQAQSTTSAPQLLGVQGIAKNFQSSRSSSPSTLAEEGASTFYPPKLPVSDSASLASPKLSVSDSASLAATRVAHATSESLNKLDKREASDRFLGESYVDDKRYASGRYVKQIKPNCLKFFELVILAHVVHREGPKYSRLGNNCFWFATTLFDLIIILFGSDMSPSTPEDAVRERKYLPYNPNMTGRWMGLKVTVSNPEEISMIKQKYKIEHRQQINQVMLCSFRITIAY